MFPQIRVQRSCFRTVHECNVPPRFGCNARVFVAYRNAMFLQIRVRCSFFCNGMHGSAGFECNARFLCKGCNVPPDSNAMLVVLHEKRDFLGCVHPFRVILVPVAAHGPLQFERFFFSSYCFGFAAGHGVIVYVPRASLEKNPGAKLL